jgi:hypothetical protein
MTNEELDAARAKEAERRWDEATEGGTRPTWVPLGVIAARLARENWTPPEPVVDPDLAAFREWESAQWPAYTCTQAAYLAGARMAREREQERAKGLVEFVGGVTTLGSNDSISAIVGVARFTLAKYRGEA